MWIICNTFVLRSISSLVRGVAMVHAWWHAWSISSLVRGVAMVHAWWHAWSISSLVRGVAKAELLRSH